MSDGENNTNFNKALFPMRRHSGKEYNIFALPGGKFEGRVFDQNRRVYCKTFPMDTVEKAIKFTRWNCETYAKGQCVGGAILIDEGKAIREKEEKEYLNFKKEVRKHNRERNV